MTYNLTEGDMGLPPGKICHDCRHFARCAWLISKDGHDRYCDWSPSRFECLTGAKVVEYGDKFEVHPKEIG